MGEAAGGHVHTAAGCVEYERAVGRDPSADAGQPFVSGKDRDGLAVEAASRPVARHKRLGIVGGRRQQQEQPGQKLREQ